MRKSFNLDIISNYAGKASTAILGIIFTPLYLYYLGIESFGIIGFYFTILVSINFLDLGLSTTINRELSKFKGANDLESARSLVNTLEVVYIILGILIGITIYSLANWLSVNWINIETIPLKEVENYVKLIGVVISCQWPISLYSGALIGLEKHITNNLLLIAFSTIRSGLVVLALSLISATLNTFFLWQAIVSFIFVLTLRYYVKKNLPKSKTKQLFSVDELKKIRKFTAGMTGIGILSFFIGSLDKILLSKILPISEFGYYILALTIAQGIGMLASPVSITLFPRFTFLVGSGQVQKLIAAYHKGCRLIAISIIPLSAFIIFFSYSIMLLWTSDNIIAEETYLLVQILTLGTIFHSFLIIPYILMLAYGWTKLTFYQNLISLILLVPLMYFFTDLYGKIGATIIWLGVNSMAFFISTPIMHNRILKGAFKKVIFYDYGIPTIISFTTACLIKILTDQYLPTTNIYSISITLIIYLIIVIMLIPETRNIVYLVRNKISK